MLLFADNVGVIPPVLLFGMEWRKCAMTRVHATYARILIYNIRDREIRVRRKNRIMSLENLLARNSSRDISPLPLARFCV